MVMSKRPRRTVSELYGGCSTQLVSCSAEKDLGVLLDTKLNVPLLLRSLMILWVALGKVLPAGQERCSFHSIQHWEAAPRVLPPVPGPSVKRDMDILGAVQQRDIKVMKRLEHLSY